jgi:hypothetical protein
MRYALAVWDRVIGAWRFGPVVILPWPLYCGACFMAGWFAAPYL